MFSVPCYALSFTIIVLTKQNLASCYLCFCRTDRRISITRQMSSQMPVKNIWLHILPSRSLSTNDVDTVLLLNSFLASALILYPLKTPWNLFTRNKMDILAWNGFIFHDFLIHWMIVVLLNILLVFCVKTWLNPSMYNDEKLPKILVNIGRF